MKNTAIYPGTFDPLTNGHLDIINRASLLFSHVYVSVTDNPNKKSFFSVEERVDMIQKAVKGIHNVSVDSFNGLLVTYMKKKNARVIIRGLRAISDFEYEFQMALMNRSLSRDVETIFLMPDENYTYLSSNLIKEIAHLGGDIKDFVPRHVRNILIRSFSGKGFCD